MVLADSAIEPVPARIHGHPAVVACARRKQKEVAELILDQNYHHAAIAKLGKSEKHRGRPDIAHVSLLLALGTPLNMRGLLKCYVHTTGDKIITVNPKTRLPRQSDRFVNLLEQLYVTKHVPVKGEPLLTLEDGAISKITKDPDIVVALSTSGNPMRMDLLAEETLAKYERPCVIIGGFSTGHFSERVLSVADEVFSISPMGLEAWTVVARALYDYERAIGL